MRSGSHKVRYVILASSTRKLTKIAEVVEVMNGESKMLLITLRGGQTHTFVGRAHADGDRVVMTSPHVVGLTATLMEDRKGRLYLKV